MCALAALCMCLLCCNLQALNSLSALQTGLRLRDRNAIIASNWKDSFHLRPQGGQNG